MKRNRIIWFCMWILSLAGISFRGGAVSYGLFAVLTLIPFFSLLYLFAVYILFHIYQNIERRYVTVNEPVRYRFSLVNECPLVFAGIRVKFFSSFSRITTLDDEPEYELQPKTRIEKETSLICRYRGEYDVGIKEIEMQDYFRLFRITYKARQRVQAVVKPQLLKLDRIGGIELSDAVRASEHNRTELDVLSREYVSGDDRRLINWSQSARTGTLMTRTQTGTANQDVAIIMDTARISNNRSIYIPAENRILEITLAVAYYFSRQNILSTEYHYQQEIVRSSVGDAALFEEFYEALSSVSFGNGNSHEALYDAITRRTDIFNSSMVFLVLSSWDSAAEKLLTLFERSGLSTVIFLVTDDEQDIPDLTAFTRSRLISISPYDEIAEDMG